MKKNMLGIAGVLAVVLAVGTGILLYLLETKHHALRYAARTRRHRGKWRK